MAAFYGAFSSVLSDRQDFQKAAWSSRDNIYRLNNARGAAATDKQDHIFGIYGLLPQCEHFIPVEYTRSAGETFELFARTHINDTKDLVLLRWAGTQTFGGRSSLLLPSWVPDWSVAQRKRLALTYEDFNASRSRPYDSQLNSVRPIDGRFNVRGVICDDIKLIQSGPDKLSTLVAIAFDAGPFDYPTKLSRLQALSAA